MTDNIGKSIFQVNRKIYAGLHKNSYMTLGNRLKEARKDARLTQKELASKVGMTQPTLSDLESGNSKGTTNILKIAAVLKVDPVWLDTGRGRKEVVTTNYDHLMDHVKPRSDSGAFAISPDNLLALPAHVHALIDRLGEVYQSGELSEDTTREITNFIDFTVSRKRVHDEVSPPSEKGSVTPQSAQDKTKALLAKNLSVESDGRKTGTGGKS
jgi:transcriptional regulator with XRE-family HTH domain